LQPPAAASFARILQSIKPDPTEIQQGPAGLEYAQQLLRCLAGLSRGCERLQTSDRAEGTIARGKAQRTDT